METVQSSRTVSFLKDALSFAVLALGIIVGLFGVAMVADMPAFPGYFEPEWSRVAGFALFGFVGILGSVIALWNRRRAGILFLLTAPIAGGCFAWWLRLGRYNSNVTLGRPLLVFAAASLPFAILGTFWFISSRLGWSPVVSRLMTTRGAQIFAGTLLFAACMVAGVFLSFYIPRSGWGNCHEYPPLSVQRFPDQAVFTAELMFAGRTPHDSGFVEWFLMRVRQRFWGLPWWAPNFVIVRGFFKVQEGQYLIDARRSQGLLTHFLPFVEQYPCCHTQRVERAVADLRALKDGPPRSGVRVLGTVYTDMFVTSEAARNLEVIATGPGGSITTTTDQEGIFDIAGLPAGHYSVQVKSENLRGYFSRAEGDVKSGEIWGATLIDHAAQTPVR